MYSFTFYNSFIACLSDRLIFAGMCLIALRSRMQCRHVYNGHIRLRSVHVLHSEPKCHLRRHANVFQRIPNIPLLLVCYRPHDVVGLGTVLSADQQSQFSYGSSQRLKWPWQLNQGTYPYLNICFSMYHVYVSIIVSTSLSCLLLSLMSHELQCIAMNCVWCNGLWIPRIHEMCG